MLDMALAACRDPDPGDVGEALETIEAALSAAGALLAAQTEDGTRAAIDLVYRAIVRAATELPDRAPQRTGQPHDRPLPLLASFALAHPEALAERPHHLVDLLLQQAPRQQVRRRV